MIFSLMRTKRSQIAKRLAAVAFLLVIPSVANCQTLSLQSLVTRSMVIRKDGFPVRFALHGFIEFSWLAELFPYMELQTACWPGTGRLGLAARRGLRLELMRPGVEGCC